MLSDGSMFNILIILKLLQQNNFLIQYLVFKLQLTKTGSGGGWHTKLVLAVPANDL